MRMKGHSVDGMWTDEATALDVRANMNGTTDARSAHVPPGSASRARGVGVKVGPVFQVVRIDPPVPTTRHLCAGGHHRWAYLAAGGAACYYCGARR